MEHDGQLKAGKEEHSRQAEVPVNTLNLPLAQATHETIPLEQEASDPAAHDAVLQSKHSVLASFAYCSLPHVVQVAAPAAEICPSLQDVQSDDAIDPVEDKYLPAAQSSHVVLSALALYLPASQSSHGSSLLLAYLPAKHDVQLPAAGEGCTFPLVHGVHCAFCVIPIVPKYPAPHASHIADEEMTVKYFPTGHSIHSDRSSLGALPAAQSSHSSTSIGVVGACFPAGHNSHWS